MRATGDELTSPRDPSAYESPRCGGAEPPGNSTPAFEHVLIGHSAHVAARHPHDYGPLGHVAGHDGARRDEGLLPDLHAGHQHRSPSYATSPSQHRALELALLVTAHGVIVCRDHTRAYEHVV